jgi:hypothetical protein
MDLEFLCQITLARHQQRIDEAARRRLLMSRRQELRRSTWRRLRSWLATGLRGLADRVEPAPSFARS